MAKILVCDDSGFMRDKIASILKDGAHEIAGEAKDGLEAVEQFKKLKPDLVTMDILMSIDGIKAIKEIMKINPSAKVVIVSILEEHQAEVVGAIQSGALGYTGKPIKKEILLGEVKRVLGS